MVDVSGKADTNRIAVARGSVLLSARTIVLLRSGGVPKGDALSVARIAGIMAAKKTAELIPLCHPLPLNHVTVDLEIGEDRVNITATCGVTGKTGVEME